VKHISYLFIAFLTAFLAARAQGSDLAISFSNPTNGAVFQSPTYLQVTATESSNTIVSAEFFANGESIGVVSNNISFPAAPVYFPGSGLVIIDPFFPGGGVGSWPFALFWTAELGDYTLTAKATDDQGNTTLSDPVNVIVIPTPVVSVQATVPIASPNIPGIFTITRTGNTNQNLNVPFYFRGTAQNGVDYIEVSKFVVISAGQFSADVTINPLVFKQGNARAVSLKLSNYLVPGEAGAVPQIAILNPPFLIGSPGEATIYIKANDRDVHKPSVRITQPKPRQSLNAGSDITITADVMDRDTGVALVEFFDRTTKLGETPAITTTLPGQHVSFNFTWTNAPAGPHLLHARATDIQGKTQVSGQVRIQVLPAP
jgi:hypothetical protein